MRYVFGPVLSRRLGHSLGIDPVPFKTCNWNCVYCQLGRTTPMTNDRRDYVPAAAVVEEVRQALQTRAPREIDWVTFLGSGEPTLHSALGWMIRHVKALTRIPVAVITNGSLFYLPEVREELMAADAVLPSLDAGSSRLYRAINRPFPACTFERLVEGLIAFRREFSGRLWVEVMLVKGLNDTTEALNELAAVLSRIAPDQVHVSSPVRPPAESWVQAPSPGDQARAASILGAAAQPVRPIPGDFGLCRCDNVVDAIVAVVSRHPMAEAEVMRALHRWTPGEVVRGLRELAGSRRVQVVVRHGLRFWTCSEARYDRPRQAPRA